MPANYLVILMIVFQVSYVLKRAIFLWGTPPQTVYYIIQLLPLPFLLLALSSAKMPPLRGHRASTYAISALLALGSIWTIVAAAGTMESYGGLFLVGVPICGYFLGVQLRGQLSKRLVIVYFVMIVLSTAYGIIQFVWGLTPLEANWAAATAPYSLQGRKVLAALSGTNADLRPFSYYPDTLTWNTSLAAALTFVTAGRTIRLIGRTTFMIALAFCLAGLLISLSRNAWLVVIVMALTYLTFRLKWVISHTGLRVIIIVSFFAAVSGSQFIMNLPGSSTESMSSGDAVLDRYATIGTLHDRAISYSLLADAATRYPLLGLGFNAKVTGSRTTAETEWLASHNLVVDTVLYWGAAGAVVFFLFLWSWLREASDAMALARDPGSQRLVRWITAYVVGAIAAAQFTGLPSLPIEFYVLTGFVSGLDFNVASRKIRIVCSIPGPSPIEAL